MVGPGWRGCAPLKFGTLTLPPEIDAGRPCLSVVEADTVAWRRFRRHFATADPRGRVFVWKREVGPRGGRLHRHLAIVTRLPHRALKRLAWRAGYGRVVNFKLATGGALSNYLAKYVAKPGVGLDAWPSRTRWAQTIIAKVQRQVPRGTPEPRGWVIRKFSRSFRSARCWRLLTSGYRPARPLLAALTRRKACFGCHTRTKPRRRRARRLKNNDPWMELFGIGFLSSEMGRNCWFHIPWSLAD